MSWVDFNYIEQVFYMFLMVSIILIGLKVFKRMNGENMKIFTINDLVTLIIVSLIVPFILVGIVAVEENTNIDVNKIIWIILILSIIKFILDKKMYLMKAYSYLKKRRGLR